MHKIGEVSSINLSTRTARVKFDSENIVSGDLRIINRKIESINDNWMPRIGDFVLCAMLDDTNGGGYILGGI